MNTPCDKLIRCGVLVTQDEGRRVIEDAGLAVIDGTVVAVGAWDEVKRSHEGEVLDLSRRLVLPGLVNSHNHAAMTAFRGFADDLPLMAWLTEHIWPVENRLDKDIIRAGTLLACAEMLSTGTTCFADMYLFEGVVAEACEKARIRGVLCEGIFSFPTRSYESPQQAFEYIEGLHESMRGSRFVRPGVAPHAVYTNTPETLQESFALAERLGLPWMIHAAENAEETAQSMEQFGKRPVAHLADLGLLTPRTLLVHMTDVTDEEIALVAERGANVSHNPRSNMKLASGICPAQKFVDAGVNVAIGTDGPGSNNALNMFMEMNAAALLQKVHRADPTTLPAASVLDAATLGGAAALGWPELGALVPGGAADLTALDLDHPGMAPLYDAASHAVYAATGAEVRLTMVAGEVVYEDGQFGGVSQGELDDCAKALKEWAQLKEEG